MSKGNRWKRPTDVPHPSIWRRFEGCQPFPNGKKPKFRVQDFTEDLMDDVMDHMKNNFLLDEPLCMSVDMRSDEKAVEEMISIWRDYTKHNLVLVCLLENKDELEDDTLPDLVGCNMTCILEPDSPHNEVNAEPLKKIFSLLEFVQCQVDCFKMYGVIEFLYALGLSVDRKFRGQGIGLEILKARFDMGKALGLNLTVTVFTAIASQKLADRVGFETIYELPYEEYKVDGEVIFKNLSMKSLKIMAARIK